MPQPVTVSVVVASHARERRLASLLDALTGQTLEAGWELVVVHDYAPAVARDLLDAHPLARAGHLRHLAIAPGTGSPAHQRNVGWRAASGELIAFTDDDCRPDGRWLERLIDGHRRFPRCVVQGRTRPDPREADALTAPHVRTLHVEPVGPYVQTCNVLYPRELLERLGGFDELAITGEDVDLSLRARAAGAEIVPAADAVVFHAVEALPLTRILRENLKWRHLAYLVARHPEFRRELTLGIFWDREHLWAALAGLGLLGAIRRRGALVLAAPYVRSIVLRRRPVRGTLGAVLDVPGQFVRQFAEVLGLAAGSVRHRTLVL